MIEVKGLTKYYGDVKAIEDVTFTVEKGEVVGFLGPNGAGKTTTMRILTAYLAPTSGTAKVAGYDVFYDSLEVRKRIGYLPETVPLYPEMSVRSYLEFMAHIRGVEKVKSRVQEVMEICNVDDVADSRIGKLSKGYRQRVGLAQALLHNPEVLILDEPTIGLDPKQIIEVRELIKRLGEDHTILLSTHILPEASQTCERVLIINEGRLVAEDTPQRLTARLEGGERVFLQVGRPSPEVVTKLKEIPGIIAVDDKGQGRYEILCKTGEDRRPEIARVAVEGGWELLELRLEAMSLEEIFLRLTTKEVEDAGHA
ncbi:MAG TPA: ATP-binding cassette domain-containing protein [Chloroflexi bacterium]|nr:ATP-binding cassette domain-containing protein [Chloroflexota bacterium]